MNIRTYIAPALLAVAALLSTSAQAATTTGILNVKLDINGTCTMNAGGTVDFGSVGGINGTPLNAQETITVNCTLGTPYQIAIDEGGTVGATVAARKMTGGLGGTVDYTLHQGSYTGTLWGNGTLSTSTLSQNGTGADETITVYGVVPTQVSPANDTYSDIVNLTITW